MEPAILYDEVKRQANIAKHGFDFAALTVAFFFEATFAPGTNGRQRAVGRFAGRIVTVVFRPYGRAAISVVSMRPASARERKLHDEERQDYARRL